MYAAINGTAQTAKLTKITTLSSIDSFDFIENSIFLNHKITVRIQNMRFLCNLHPGLLELKQFLTIITPFVQIVTSFVRITTTSNEHNAYLLFSFHVNPLIIVLSWRIETIALVDQNCHHRRWHPYRCHHANRYIILLLMIEYRTPNIC